MKTVYVVRHCKAEGQERDAKLTEAGAAQAEQLAQFLIGKEIDSIISSPFERAYRTIAPLAEMLGIEVELDERLAERTLSGSDHPDWRDMLMRTYDDLDLSYEGGESSNAAMNRAVRVVEKALNSAHNNVVLVSHGNLISLLLKHYDNRIGFREWEALTNPDVFQLCFVEDKPNIKRIWAD